MEAERWQRVRGLFHEALERPTVERESFLDAACGADPSLRAELESLLESHRTAGSFLEHGPTLPAELAIPRLEDEEDADSRIGQRLGAYEVVRTIGRGGMGTVYLGRRADGQFSQDVAIKLVSRGMDTELLLRRFRAEREILARFDHPNISRILDAGASADGLPYFVMEYIDGEPIDRHCQRNDLSIPQRLALFIQVCNAVQYAHQNLVVHRDLKPSNVLVTATGLPKLVDFGIAKLLGPEASETGNGLRLMTPEYASPEQVRGHPVTTGTDVHALGALLYELLCGQSPFASFAHDPGGLARAILGHNPPPLSQVPSVPHRLRRALRGDLDTIVARALRKDPARRYASAEQLAADVGRHLRREPVTARRDSLAYRVRKFVARHRGSVAVAALVAVALSGFGVLAGWQARRAAAERDVARVERDKADKVVGLLVDLFESSNPNMRPDGDKMLVGEFLGQAEARVIDTLQGQPVIRAKLRQVFGRIHEAREEYEPARKALTEALAEQRRLLGPDDPEAIESLHHLGELQLLMGDVPTARALLEESLDRCERRFGADHEKTARALVAVAPALRRAGRRVEEVCLLHERALAIRRRVLPPHHPDLAASLSSLALCYRDRGDRSAGRALYAEALAIFRRPENRRHPGAIDVMNAYATLLDRLNEYEAAESLQLEALALARSLFGADSRFVAGLLNNRGVNLTRRGLLGEAEQAFREAYDRHVALFGEDNWRASNAARNIGLILALQERYEDGLPWIDRALDASEREPRPRTVALYSYYWQRALMLLRLGRGDEALPILQAAEADLLAMGPGSETEKMLANVRVGLARTLTETGRPAEAEEPARQALATREALGPEDPERAEAACELGRALVLVGRSDEGRALLEPCLPVYRRWGEKDAPLIRALEALLDPAAPSATPAGP